MKLPKFIFRKALYYRYPQYDQFQIAALHTLKFAPWGKTLSPLPEDSALYLADKNAQETYGEEDVVSSSALFSTMSSADNLSTIGILLQDKFLMKDVGTVPFLTLCRASIESSARAIWTLSPDSESERIQRAIKIRRLQLIEESRFHKRASSTYPSTDPVAVTAKARVKEIEEALSHLKAQKVNGRVEFRDMAAEVQLWLDNQPPLPNVHKRNKDLATQMKDLYSVGSAGTHGYSWITKLVSNPGEMFSMTFAMIAPAILSLEYAITLVEAHARPTPTSPKWIDATPEYLDPLVEWWHPKTTDRDITF